MPGAWLLFLIVLACPAVAGAQGAATPAPPDATPASRADALEALRIAREASLHPEQPGRVERLLLFAEDRRLIERLNPPQGFFPIAGNVVRGSGLGLGVGYRRRPAGQRLLFETTAAWTYRNYRALQVSGGLPAIGGRPFALTTGIRWFDYPQEDFFGLGRTSLVGDRVSFTLRGTDTFAQVQGRRAGWFVLRGRAGVQRFDVAAGRDARFPSLDAWIRTNVRGWSFSELVDDEQLEALVVQAQRGMARFVQEDGSVAFGVSRRPPANSDSMRP